jgi:hypothetical protein
VYGSWGGGTVQRGDQWAQTARVTNNRTGQTTRATRTDSGAGAVTRRGPGADSGAVRTAGGDVYAGRDGNVYKKQDGGWQKYDNGSWGSVDRPTPQSGTRQSGAAAGPTATSRDRSTASGPPAPRGNVTMDQLDRDSRARSEGAQRTRDYGSYQRSGGSRSSAGSYRGSRGGGRRR